MKPLGTNIGHLMADYGSVTGKPFRHFFCPTLHVDEDVGLAGGMSFPNHSEGRRGFGMQFRRKLFSEL